MSATKLWLDGCFDGFHFAHANAVRQAVDIAPGPVEVVVGVHSDAEITKHKGPPLFDEKERYELVRSCRWVSRVVEDVPYVTAPDVFEKYNVDLIVHGDDPATDADGNDCYAIPKALGRFKEVKRTEGISTTSLIDRVLHPDKLSDLRKAEDIHLRLRALLAIFSESCVPRLPIVDLRSQYGDAERLFPSEQDRTFKIYVEGTWDCFCTAHVEVLRYARETAKAMSSNDTNDVIVRLVVGVDDDKTAEERLGEPSVFLQYERALDVAQCRLVDAIVIKNEQSVSHNKLVTLGVQAVFCWDGQRKPDGNPKTNDVVYVNMPDHINSKGRGFYSPGRLRERVQSNLAAYEERQRRKASRT